MGEYPFCGLDDNHVSLLFNGGCLSRDDWLGRLEQVFVPQVSTCYMLRRIELREARSKESMHVDGVFATRSSVVCLDVLIRIRGVLIECA